MSAITDKRPPFAVGHVRLHVADVAASTEYYLALGLRSIYAGEDIGILELRGGTHLLLFPAEEPVADGGPAPFDLMADDIAAAHAHCTELGFAPSAVFHANYHERFTLRDPSGYELTVNSTHASGEPI